MLAKLRGFTAQNASYKTAQEERGLFGYPDNLRIEFGDPASALDYDRWFAALEKAGVTTVKSPADLGKALAKLM